MQTQTLDLDLLDSLWLFMSVALNYLNLWLNWVLMSLGPKNKTKKKKTGSIEYCVLTWYKWEYIEVLIIYIKIHTNDMEHTVLIFNCPVSIIITWCIVLR